MKFSEQWLREWVNPPIDTKQLVEQLTMAGLEIESVLPVAGQFNDVVIGQVLEAVQHPDAERLRVCQVNIGANESLNIVCGAANVRAGLKVPVALVNATLPNGITIKATKLRGVVSQGMICSTSELGLTETSDGIMELPEDAPIGKDFRAWLQLDDNAIDIHVTPNRGDCLSVAGVAREVAVLNNCDLAATKITAVPAQTKEQFPIKVLAADACPRYLGRVIRNINPKVQTPMWMIERLRRSGLRSIHPVVDVTNYVLVELGQPLHAFDLAKLNAGIVVRFAKSNEEIQLLDGQKIKLDPETLVIADESQPQAMAGIMGGINSAVSEQTTDIFLESAFFNPEVIAGRARRYSLDTDSAYRYERGVDPKLAPKAIERATDLLLKIVGGEPGPVAEVVDSSKLHDHPAILLRRSRIAKVLATDIPPEQIEIILQRLGFSIKKQDNDWQVIPPSHRFDINLEEDVIEEVIRIYGYQKVPVISPQARLQVGLQSEQVAALSRLRKFFIDRGYHEAITYSFVAPKLQQLIEPQQPYLTLKNPLSSDLSAMRTSLWPGLLSTVSYNQNRQQPRVRLFETGLRFLVNGKETLQQPMLAGVLTGDVVAEQWTAKPRPVDFFDLKGEVEALFTLMGDVNALTFTKAEHPALHPGQASGIHYQNKAIGLMGALHPALLSQLDLQGPLYIFELELAALTKTKSAPFKSFSKFPAIRRDISFIVTQAVTAQQILDKVREVAGDLLADLCLFDVYQGKGVETGFRSLALGLIWQHPERTLVDDQVNAQMERVIAALKQNFDISLRD